MRGLTYEKALELASKWQMAYPESVVQRDLEFFRTAKGQALQDQALTLGFLKQPLQFGHPDCWAIRKARSIL